MSPYSAGVLMGLVIGTLVGFLVAYWLILAYTHGWIGNRP